MRSTSRTRGRPSRSCTPMKRSSRTMTRSCRKIIILMLLMLTLKVNLNNSQPRKPINPLFTRTAREKTQSQISDSSLTLSHQSQSLSSCLTSARTTRKLRLKNKIINLIPRSVTLTRETSHSRDKLSHPRNPLRIRRLTRNSTTS